MLSDESTRQCAAALLDTFHFMMRTIKLESRKRSAPEFSMQQFRAMKIIEHNEGASLSLVADRLGATLSATSKLVDGLVDRNCVCRNTAKNDRRKLILALTDTGEQALESIHMEMLSCLAERLILLSPNECAMLNLSMDMLRSVLESEQSAQNRQSAN